MLQVVYKQKLTLKSIAEKYKIIKEVNIGNSCASVAKTHNIPKQTLLNWLKKKKQVYESIDSKSSTMKRQRFRGLPYEDLGKTCYKWLVNARGQNIPISDTMLKTKALFFAREFLAQDVCKFIETSETKHDTKMCLHSNIWFIGTFELDLIRIPVSIQLESAKI